MTLLSRDWQRQQIRGFSMVCKNILDQKNICFNSIETDFKDSTKLLYFLEIIGKTQINNGKWNQKPRNIFAHRDNFDIALNHLRNQNIDLTGISTSDILNGNINSTLGLIFRCIKYFRIENIEDGNQKAKDALLSWCKKCTITYGVNIKDFQKSWKSGLAFCAIIHYFHSELFNFKSLLNENINENWNVFIHACKKLGINLCFDENDAGCEDEQLILTQVYEMYHFFNNKEKIDCFNVPLEILKEISQFPLNSDLSHKFSSSYQNSNNSVQHIQQQINSKDPNVQNDIQKLQITIKNDINDEIQQLENYIKSFCNSIDLSSRNDQKLYNDIKKCFGNLINNEKHKEYLKNNNHIASISTLFDEKSKLIWGVNEEKRCRDLKIDEYKTLFNQIFQYFNNLQSNFGLHNYNSSELSSISDESNKKLKSIFSKYDHLKNLNYQIDENQFSPYIIQSKFEPLLNRIRNAIDTALQNEQKVLEYKTIFNQTFQYINNLHSNFEGQDLNISELKSISNEAQDKINLITSRFNELQKLKCQIDESQFDPNIIKSKYDPLLQKIKNAIDTTLQLERKINDYKTLYDQSSQYLNGLQSNFEKHKLDSSYLKSISNEAQTKINSVISKYNELKGLKCQIDESKFNPSIIQSKYEPLLQRIKTSITVASRIERKVSEYENLCDNKLSNFNSLKQQFTRNQTNRSILVSINTQISDILPSLDSINKLYDDLGNGKVLVNSKYLPRNITTDFNTFSKNVQESIASIDQKKVSAFVTNNQISQLNESFQTTFENDLISKLADHVYNATPILYDQRYPIDMTIVQPEYWKSPSIYDTATYSDIHEPILCKNEQQMIDLLHNKYKVPSDLQHVLGGERVVLVYSNLISSMYNDKPFIIRCPHALGFQRNQDPNSLYIHVKTRKVQVLDIGCCRNIYDPMFFIKIQNTTNQRLHFVFPKGSIVDLPIHQQPIYIAETWEGDLSSFEIKQASLKWFCMNKAATTPNGDAKLTPFIYFAPEKYCNGEYNSPWTPDSDNWWNNVQPNLSGKISELNNIWKGTEKETVIQEIITESRCSGLNPEWNYLPIKDGGIINNSLFNLLNENRNCIVSSIVGVERFRSMTKPEDANNAMVYTNQMGIVITIQYTNTHILIEKTDSGKWEGGICSYNDSTDTYLYTGITYHKDFSSIYKNNFYLGRIINGMRSDPKYFNSITYNSQNSRHYLLGTLGINIPLIHNGQVFIPSLHNLINY